MINIEHKISFDIIREKVKQKCSTDFAKKRVEEESFSTNKMEIERRLSLTDELRIIAMFEPKFPQENFADCNTFLKKLEIDYSSISLENIKTLSIFLRQVRQILSFLNSCDPDKYPYLRKEAKPIKHFLNIEQKIDTIIDKNGDIKESASEDLAKVSKDLRNTQNSIGRKIESILKKAKADGIAEEEATISIRDGKMLIPVAANNKKEIKGIVQGESATGKTFFIEPLEVVEMNNRIRELEFAKQREIARILLEFTDYLRPYLQDLQISAKFIGEIDFVRAKAECARNYRGGKPILSKDQTLRIKDGRHPILEWALAKENKPIIPLNLELNRKKHILIISGPNAGGKSACLKTVGILQYMLQWGLLLPCSEVSEFPIVKQIFVDIGDEQSLENDLSTYSSHLLNMKRLLQKADKDTLALIDEFGSGTEPTAGGAIAETILEELESRGSWGVITTHYTNIKVYAENSNGVINGAMLFDSINIQPLYKLEIGTPGNSFAFDLARKIGLNENIIKKAEKRAGENFIDLEKQLRKISKNRKKLEEKLNRIKFTDKNLEDVTERYTQELSKIKQAKKEIIEGAKKEAKQILDNANKQIEATIKTIKEAQAEKEKTKIVREELKLFSQNIEKDTITQQDKKIEKKMEQLLARKQRQTERKNRVEENSYRDKKVQNEKKLSLEVGAKVKVKDSELLGEVSSLDKKYAIISIGEIKSKIKITDIEVISNKEFSDISKTSGLPQQIKKSSLNVSDTIDNRKLHFKTQIDIRGQRVSEAMTNVSKFIDDAMLVGAKNISILHGKGGGILKEEIRKWLRTVPEVESFSDEDVRFGGSGITLIVLK